MLEGLFTALEDTFPTLLRKYKKVFLENFFSTNFFTLQISLLLTCLFFFIIGIPMVTYAGAHWLTLVDAYGASGIALLFVVFFEVVGLAWGFGEKIPFICVIVFWKQRFSVLSGKLYFLPKI